MITGGSGKGTNRRMHHCRATGGQETRQALELERARSSQVHEVAMNSNMQNTGHRNNNDTLLSRQGSGWAVQKRGKDKDE
jgi:hypothetical protein